MLTINSKLSGPEPFSSNQINNSDIEKKVILKNLNIKKATTFKNMPLKVLESSVHSCSETLTKLFNDKLNNNEFPHELKSAEVTATFKKDDPTKSKNCRPVSVLPTIVSKVFEKLYRRQMSIFVENFLSPYMCGY